MPWKWCQKIGSATFEGFNLSDGSSPGDWRLPNIIELWSLIDFNEYGQNYYGDHGVCYGTCEGEALPAGHPFIIEDDPRMGWFWTNTAYAGHVHETDGQIDKGKFMVKPLGGAIVSSAADILGWVWPVRGKAYIPTVFPWINLLLANNIIVTKRNITPLPYSSCGAEAKFQLHGRTNI